MGIWNNASKICGALIVSKISNYGDADIIYIYGPSNSINSIPWKQQRVTGLLRGGYLLFQDDQNSSFKFSLGSPIGAPESLQGEFYSGSGNLTAPFLRMN